MSKAMTSVGFAVSDKRTTSVAFPEVLMCDCKNGGSCNFNQLVDGNDIVNDRYSVSACH